MRYIMFGVQLQVYTLCITYFAIKTRKNILKNTRSYAGDIQEKILLFYTKCPFNKYTFVRIVQCKLNYFNPTSSHRKYTYFFSILKLLIHIVST